jgi:hypothetical protein
MPHATCNRLTYGSFISQHLLFPPLQAFSFSYPAEVQIEHLDHVPGGIMTPEHRAQMRRLAKVCLTTY